MEQQSPTAIDNMSEVKSLTRNSLTTSSSATLDIIVTTTSDVVDFEGAQQIADLPGPDGVVSLREAIIATNHTSGPQTIGFNIPTSDPGFDGSVFTIQPHPDQLPGLSDAGTSIDGSSQIAFTGNTNTAGPEIFLDGSLIDPNAYCHGILIGSAANHVHGLAIGGFSIGIGIGYEANDNLITGCFVGLDPAGAAAQPNRIWGIAAGNSASENGLRIGGPTIEERNVISGNEGYGIFVAHNLQHCIIQNNYLGTDATGLVALHNSNGIFVDNQCQDVVIQDNLISGNEGWGIYMNNCDEITIQGNLIGVDVTGHRALPNSYDGIALGNSTDIIVRGNLSSGNLGSGITMNTCDDITIQGNIIGPDIEGDLVIGNRIHGIGVVNNSVSSRIRIGGTGQGECNLISGSTSGGICLSALILEGAIEGNRLTHNHDGIRIHGAGGSMLIKRNFIASNNNCGITFYGPGTGYTISQNEIYDNYALGIDLAPEGTSGGDGVTPNDQGDIDTGPNNLMNYPVLESAKAKPGKLIVKGYIDTPNPKNVTIEFFANPVPTPGGDPSGYGEGAIYLGSDHPNPHGKINATLPTIAPGTLITATATDAAGNTSEFSAYIEAK